MKRLTLVIFFVMALQNSNALAQTSQKRLLLANCAIGAEEYAHHALIIDKFYLKLIDEGRRDRKAQDIGDAVFKYHHEYEEEEATKNYKIMQKQIEKGWAPEIADALRVMMAASIKIAFLEAVKNMKAGTLGRSKDFYERKIYDSCTSDNQRN
jgi:hypothetical protein